MRQVALHSPLWHSDTELLAMADSLQQTGEIVWGGYKFNVGLPFRESDLDQGLPSSQLKFASLVVPELFLEAYRISGRREFFVSARDVILAWARYERQAWLPRGFLWNDHAVAARVPVLAQFWADYRNDPNFDSEVAREILEFALRTGSMLAKDSHFTFATNHGVMQNIALLHLSAAFPGLPGAENFTATAVKRLVPQFRYYINNEGVVLEHSAGYHRDGLSLMGMVLWHLSLHNVATPKSWISKYVRAQAFYSQLRRPDGSLPMFGDTHGEAETLGPLVAELDNDGRALKMDPKYDWRPRLAYALYPVAGFGIWWSGLEHWPGPAGMSQTVVTWSNFPGHGHKLMDELSVLYWANGQTWWSNVGYWPYGVNGRDDTTSWIGSNAPHWKGEGDDSGRVVQLLGAGRSDELAAIDLKRETTDGYRVRRQVVDFRGRLCVVLDAAFDTNGRRTQSVWRSFPDVIVEKGLNRSGYRLHTRNGMPAISVVFAGPDLDVREPAELYAGVEGAIAQQDGPRPTPAFRVSHASDGRWAAVVWSTSDDELQYDIIGMPSMATWRDPSNWELAIRTDEGEFVVRRTSMEVEVKDTDGRRHTVQLKDAGGITEERGNIQNALAAMKRQYTKHADLVEYRTKATYALILLLLIQEAFFLSYRRLRGRYYRGLRAFSLVCWIALGLWMPTFYFRT
jgi:hypothetical protein